MKKKTIIKAISALSKVVEANKGLLGTERVSREANEMISELIKKI